MNGVGLLSVWRQFLFSANKPHIQALDLRGACAGDIGLWVTASAIKNNKHIHTLNISGSLNQRRWTASMSVRVCGRMCVVCMYVCVCVCVCVVYAHNNRLHVIIMFKHTHAHTHTYTCTHTSLTHTHTHAHTRTHTYIHSYMHHSDILDSIN